MQVKSFLVCAAITITATGGLAASLPIVRHPTVPLPSGGVEQITYTGDVAPKVRILPSERPIRTLIPATLSELPLAGLSQVAADMDWMAASMDRDLAAAIQQTDAVDAAAPVSLGNPMSAALEPMPAGSESYSFVTTISGNNVCTRELQVTGAGNGAKPKVVSHTSGNCAGTNTHSPQAAFGDRSSSNTQLTKVQASLPPTGVPSRHI